MTKIDVKGIGPVEAASITFKPLTIFIGPNNSGKSYTAMLLSALNHALTSRIFINEVSRKVLKKLSSRISIEKAPEDEILDAIPDAIISSLRKDFPTSHIRREIERVYSCNISDIINHNIGTLEINVNNKFLNYSLLITKDEIKINNVNLYKEKVQKFLEILKKFSKRTPEILQYFLKLLTDFYIRFTLFNIFKLYDNIWYLPAARSGILQAHRAIAATIVYEAPYIPIARTRIETLPRLTGVVADFISNLLTIPRREVRTPPPYFPTLPPYFPTILIDLAMPTRKKKELQSCVNFLEEVILEGEIDVKIERESMISDIVYRQKDTTYPIHSTSSMVSELAPLDLYVKYLVSKGDLLIIEEPEAHVHPEKQRSMARFLVKLVRSGVNLLITTHSDYILAQLNNFILAGTRKPEVRAREKYNEDYLKPEEISAYLFKKNDKGYVATPLEVTEEGIPEEEFAEVARAIGNEYARLYYSK